MEVTLNGLTFLIDEGDWERLRGRPWRAVINNRGRLCVTRQTGAAGNVKNIYIQQEILGCPRGMWVDHINRNPADNRRSNLRICTAAQNAMNRGPQRNNLTGFKGVSPKKKRFCARIKDGARVRLIGSFRTPEEAALAYDDAASKAFGQFAWLNALHHPRLSKAKVQNHG